MKPVLIWDCEVYRNYFCVAFKSLKGKVMVFERFNDEPLGEDEHAKLLKILSSAEIVSFNGINFDMAVLSAFMHGRTNSKIKDICDAIITKQLKSWQTASQFNLIYPEVDHIDLIEIAPGMCSLKAYGGRMGSKRMQDLPYDPAVMITEEMRVELVRYCINDLDTTIDLYTRLLPQIELRRTMSQRYGIDLRSKSDAQIAEAVIVAEVTKVIGFKPNKPMFMPDMAFNYTPPAYIKFKTPEMQAMFKVVESAIFTLSDKGVVVIPESIAALDITIGGRTYKMGIGGLHSQEKGQSLKAEDGMLLADWDVASYYPAVIINQGLFPENLTRIFLDVYRGIRDERLVAKRNGDKTTADVLKIVLNGSYGKFGSKYSMLFSPSLLIQTTITGQLTLLMMIEFFEMAGIKCMSANTDGIVLYCPIEKEEFMVKVIRKFEKITSLEMERTDYAALYSKDVNNYIAVKTDGKVKTKGAYAYAGLSKNPANEICVDAIVAYLKEGTPLVETVKGCYDMRKFVTVRQVTGGAVKDGVVLGKAIRWYMGGGNGVITYRSNGNLVPRSEGAVPMMEMLVARPYDLDLGWYVNECGEMLIDLGVVARPIVVKLPRKNSNAWKQMVVSGHITIDAKGVGCWAKGVH